MSPQNQNALFTSIAIILGCITTFIAGFTLANLLSTENNPGQTPSPTTSPVPTTKLNLLSQEQNAFLPGKHYFTDTIFVINKSSPHHSLIASSTRFQRQTESYLQNTRVSYFNGYDWNRVLDDQVTTSSSIFSDEIIKEWKIDTHPSRVLKEKVSGKIQIANTLLSFQTQELQNEIGMRSLPGYTKFMSHGNGTLIVDNTPYDAYILYTRIYSLNAADIQVYDHPLGLTTDWIAFWDTLGYFYHIDKTDVTQETDIYKTHQIGIKVDPQNTVSKAFSVSSQKDSHQNPRRFTYKFSQPIDATLQLTKLNAENKSPNNSYIWQMGQIEGTVTLSTGEKTTGFGIFEYIKD